MRYLKHRQEFLIKETRTEFNQKDFESSLLIKEAFENDITWGGSLLGRLINSTIRKGKIYFQAARIGSLVKDVENELNNLIAASAFGENTKKEIEKIKVKFLITEVYKESTSNKEIDEKLTILLGDKSDDSGLISTTIKDVEKVDKKDLPNKDLLVKKLEDYRKALLEIDFEPKESEEEKQEETSSNKEFYETTIDLLESILDLNEIISKKKITSEKSIEVGKEYTHKSKDGKKTTVLVISLEHAVKRGIDKKFLTKDDVVQSGTIKPNVFVIFRDEKTKSYLPNSAPMSVRRDSLTPILNSDTKKGPDGRPLQVTTLKAGEKVAESLFYENESLPIFEEAELKLAESNARAAWNKVLNSWSKSGIIKTLPRIQELLTKSKTNNAIIVDTITKIGREVVMNEATVGKPISFEELIKEAEQSISYSDISKSISLIARIILAFREDMGLVNALTDAKECLNKFIKSFNQLKKLYPSLKKEKKEDKEEKNESFIHNYFSFVNEADDIEMETDEDTDKDEQASKSDQELINDKISTIWFEFFKKGEEDEWKIDEKEAKKLQEDTDKELEEKEIEIDAESFKDNIIRIVNIFGRAYKMYATEVIPSGRPNGVISQKTFREYTYIGKGEYPSWSKDAGPSVGPWAANVPFEKWEDGIMKLLEDTKYRKILANAKFKNRGPNQKAGSGRTLFTFINDMLGSGGKDRDFRSKRHRLLTDYFGGNSDIEKTSDTPEPGPGKIKKDDMGSEKQLVFSLYSQLGRGADIVTSLFGKDDKYGREFFKITYKEDKVTKYLIGFIQGQINGTRDKGIVIKFHKYEKTPKQSIFSTYLKNKLDSKELELPKNLSFVPNEPLFVAVININKYPKLSKDRVIEMKVAEVTSNNTFSNIQDLKMNFQKIEALSKNNVQEGKLETIKVIDPDDRPKYDILGLDKMRSKMNDFDII
jgi:hypothetical protein